MLKKHYKKYHLYLSDSQEDTNGVTMLITLLNKVNKIVEQSY